MADVEKIAAELRERAEWRAANEGPFTKQNLVEWRAADELSRLREVERMAKEATRPFLEVDIALSRAHLQGHLGAGDLVLASVEAVRVASDLCRALSTQVEERE